MLKPLLPLLLFIGLQAQAQTLEQVRFSDVLAEPSRLPDQVIRYGEAESQFVELWKPRFEHHAPVIALVHGGCWLDAYGVDHVRPAATALANAGFAVWAIEYRRLGDEQGGWPASKNDIVQALLSLSETTDSGLDLSRLVIAGHSAGGHLALLAMDELSDAKRIEPKITIGLAAITDLSSYAAQTGSCQSAGAQFLATAERPEQINVAKQASYSRTLFAGSADEIVGMEQSYLANAERVAIEKAGHFDFIHPQTSAWQAWVAYVKQQLNNPDN